VVGHDNLLLFHHLRPRAAGEHCTNAHRQSLLLVLRLDRSSVVWSGLVQGPIDKATAAHFELADAGPRRRLIADRLPYRERAEFVYGNPRRYVTDPRRTTRDASGWKAIVHKLHGELQDSALLLLLDGTESDHLPHEVFENLVDVFACLGRGFVKVIPGDAKLLRQLAALFLLNSSLVF